METDKQVYSSNNYERKTDKILDRLIETIQGQIEEYFNGMRKTFDLPIITNGTPFQEKVWESLQQVPYGTTRTYGQQSKLLGSPKAIRAIAHANGQNPIAILIPCHRIVGSKGELTGYSGGLWRKQWLLEHESPAAKLF